MSRVSTLTIGLVAAGLFSIGFVLAQETQKGQLSPRSGLCCVQGEYRGTHTDTKNRACTNPKSEDLTLVMKQEPDCGAKVRGTITGASGPPQDFTGTLAKGFRPCCTIELTMANHTNRDRTKISGTICWKNGEWVGSGTYTSSSGCAGTWKMTKR